MTKASLILIACFAGVAAAQTNTLRGQMPGQQSELEKWTDFMASGSPFSEKASSDGMRFAAMGGKKTAENYCTAGKFANGKCSQYIGSRKTWHDTLVAETVASMKEVAEELEKKNNETPTIYAMRGNTAAGKTTTISSGMVDDLKPLLEKKFEGKRTAINPDLFKPLIKTRLASADAGAPAPPAKGWSDFEAHAESSHIAAEVMTAIKDAKTAKGNACSFVIDKRLPEESSISAIVGAAAKNGRKVFLVDVDCPLELSAMGVLKRVPGGDSPLPPWEPVAQGGYEPIESNRGAIINFFKDESKAAASKYLLFKTNPNYSKTLVAKVKDNKLTVQPGQQADFDKLTTMSADKAHEEAVKVAATKITAQEAEKVCGQFDPKYKGGCVGAMKGEHDENIGKTLKQAVDDHAKKQAPHPASGYIVPDPDLMSKIKKAV